MSEQGQGEQAWHWAESGWWLAKEDEWTTWVVRHTHTVNHGLVNVIQFKLPPEMAKQVCANLNRLEADLKVAQAQEALARGDLVHEKTVIGWFAMFNEDAAQAALDYDALHTAAVEAETALRRARKDIRDVGRRGDLLDKELSSAITNLRRALGQDSADAALAQDKGAVDALNALARTVENTPFDFDAVEDLDLTGDPGDSEAGS